MSVALRRIEELYAGAVGTAYYKRNRGLSEQRLPFWAEIDRLSDYQVESVLEVGSGEGENLPWWTVCQTVVGLDVNHAALKRLHDPGLGIQGSAAKLPFLEGSFDLVFTSGLLIHIPEPDLSTVYDELIRVSKKYILLVEYEDVQSREIPWHGLREVLWARPFGLQFWRHHPELTFLERGDLTQEQGFDRCGWSLWRKPYA